MTKYVLLVREPNTSGWDFLGEEEAQSPEQAVKKMGDTLDKNNPFDGHEFIKGFSEKRLFEVASTEDGSPKSHRFDQLDL